MFGVRQCSSINTKRSANASPVSECLIANETRSIMLAAKVSLAPGYKGCSASDEGSKKE